MSEQAGRTWSERTGEGSLLETLAGVSRVLVFSNFSRAELEKPAFGGSRLIAAQADFFREEGCDIHVVDLERLAGVTGLALRLAGVIRRRRRRESGFLPFDDEKGEKRIWRLNLLFNLLVEILSRLDVVARRRIGSMLKPGAENLLVWNYPFGIRILCRVRDSVREGRVRVFVYEHNIEGDFYHERVGMGLLFARLAGLFGRIELDNIAGADRVLCASPRDMERLESSGVDPERLEVWVPRPRHDGRGRSSRGTATPLEERLSGRYVIGFIGSDYGPNVIAVQHILGMAPGLAPEAVFLVIGSVCGRFAGEAIPDNVMLAGFVDDLEEHLGLCDAFISPKTTSDTGVEIKMMDYMKWGRPVFATAAGARGFEDYPGLIITGIEGMEEAIRSRIAGKRGAT
ncbi:MAG: glycosyltransferase [Actinobacteria bacterium]|jgi:hypothetical protein|nr:MAG: glycosyltransferase [Actinomycetota bacterium]